MKMRQANLISNIATIFVLTVSCLSASALANEVDFSVSEDGLISMKAYQAPVEALVTTIGNEFGIKVSFPNPVTEVVSVEFTDLTLEQAIKQLTQSYILVSGKDTEQDIIKEIIVMPEGEASSYLPQEGDVAEQIRQASEASGAVESSLETMTEQERANQFDQMRRRLDAGVEEGTPPDSGQQPADETPPLTPIPVLPQSITNP